MSITHTWQRLWPPPPTHFPFLYSFFSVSTSKLIIVPKIENKSLRSCSVQHSTRKYRSSPTSTSLCRLPNSTHVFGACECTYTQDADSHQHPPPQTKMMPAVVNIHVSMHRCTVEHDWRISTNFSGKRSATTRDCQSWYGFLQNDKWMGRPHKILPTFHPDDGFLSHKTRTLGSSYKRRVPYSDCSTCCRKTDCNMILPLWATW
jgi:hypothetical protein